MASRRNRGETSRPMRGSRERLGSAAAHGRTGGSRARENRTMQAAIGPRRTSTEPIARHEISRTKTMDIHRTAADKMSNDEAAQWITKAIESKNDECDDIERQMLAIISRSSVYSDIELTPGVVIDDDDGCRSPTVVSGIGLSRKMRRELGRNSVQ